MHWTNPAQSVHDRLARLYLKSAQKLARRREPAARLHALEQGVAAAAHAQFGGDVSVLRDSVALVRDLQTQILRALGVAWPEHEIVAVLPMANPRGAPKVQPVKWATRLRLRRAKKLNINDEAAVVAAVEKIQKGDAAASPEPGKPLSKQDQESKAELSRVLDAYNAKLYKPIMDCIKGGRRNTTGGDRQDALDVMQATALKVMRNIGKFEFREPVEGTTRFGKRVQFFSWLKRIALNECMDWSRKMGKAASKKKAQSLLDKLKAREIPEELRGEVEYSVKAERIAQVIRESMARLPKKKRDIILMADMRGMSGAQMAEALKKPRQTVSHDLNESRKALQKLIHERLTPKKVETPAEIAALSEEEAEDVVAVVQRKLEAAQKEVAALKAASGKKKNPSRRRRKNPALARLMRL